MPIEHINPVYDLFINNAGIGFAATHTGLLRTNDSGNSWILASERPESTPATTAIAMSPAFETDGVVFSGINGAIMRSSDGGVTWFSSTLENPPPTVTAIVLSPSFEHDGTLLAGTLEDGIMRSTDYGRSFHRQNFGLLDLSVTCLDYSTPDTVLVGTETGLYRSTNTGLAYRETDIPEVAVVGIAHLNQRIIAATRSHGLLFTEDGGVVWQPLMNHTKINNIIQFCAENDTLWMLLATKIIRVNVDNMESFSEFEIPVVDAQPSTFFVPPSIDSPLLIGFSDGTILQKNISDSEK